MKLHIALLPIIFALFPFVLSAQVRYKELEKAQSQLWKDDSIKDRNSLNKNSITVFSEDSYKFTLFLNEKRQNTKPVDEIRVEGLSNPFYDLRISFQDATLPSISKRVRVVTPQGANADVIYKLKYNDNGELILFFLCDVPVKKNALTYESGRRVKDISGNGTRLYDYYDDTKGGTVNNNGGNTVTTTRTSTVTSAVATPDGSNTSMTQSGGGQANARSGNATSNVRSLNTESGTAVYQPGTVVVNTLQGGRKPQNQRQLTDNSAKVGSESNSAVSGTVVTQKVETIKDTNASYYYKLTDTATRVEEIVVFNDSNTMTVPQEQFRTDISDNDVAKFRCPPMEDSAFTALLKSIPSSADDDTKLELAQKGSANGCMTCEQILQICQLMRSDKKRYEFAEYAYPKTADPYNYRIVGGSMFNVKYQKKLQQFVARANRQ